jgi:hypothetical protein
VIHKDNFTETMDGIVTLLRIIKSDGNISYPPLCRSIMMMSCFMIENVFWNTVRNFVLNPAVNETVKNTIETELADKIGFGKAADTWPELLTGRKFDFSKEPFASLRVLVEERNDITHSDRISYYSYYIDTYEGASSAYFTALECAKAIEQHFNGEGSYSYSNFEKVFYPPEKILFQRVLNHAKKNSIQHLTATEFPQNLRSLEEYQSCSRRSFEEVASNIFGTDYEILFNSSLSACEYSIKVANYFQDSVYSLNETQKKLVASKLSPLFKNLTMKKMVHGYGVRFGEVLPHVKLKIKRLIFQDHHGYMCMPVRDDLLVFIIDTNSIELTDFIKNV